MALVSPVPGGYKQRDRVPKEQIQSGDLFRSNWIFARYMLQGMYPSEHEGDDIVGMGFNCYGVPVLAVYDGVVTYAAKVPNGTWGKKVVIKHDGFSSRYAHLATMTVKVGDVVRAGQQIGTIGSAEGKLAPHLHFAICVTDLLQRDPLNWPSSGRSEAAAHALIAANYVDPLKFIKEHAMSGKSDLDLLLADSADNRQIKVFVEGQWPAFDLTAKDLKIVVPPPPVEPVESDEAEVITLSLRVRTTPEILPNNILGSFSIGTIIGVSKTKSGQFRKVQVAPPAFSSLVGGWVSEMYLDFL